MLHVNKLKNFPKKWLEWHTHICELLEIQPDISLTQQSLHRPWFLIPVQSELQEEHVVDLINTIREHLCSQGRTLKNIRNTLLSLQPDKSIIFLYAMRYIAFSEAGKHSYWPAFHKMMFANELTYQEVIQGLASTTSTLWIRLYEKTNRVLYFPREGLRHIKWPLSHAGLIPEDKEILKDFGLSVFHVSEEQFTYILSAEIDEFILFFKDWLNLNPLYQNTRFGQLMLSNRQEKEIIAELGQQRLKNHQHEIVESYKQKGLQSKSTIIINRRLSYNPRNNQISLNICVGRLKGKHHISFQWNDEKKQIQIQYKDSTDETIPIEYRLPIVKPDLPKQIIFLIDTKSSKINIPQIEKNKGIVFESNSGSKTKRWKFGEEYYVLLPGKLLKPKWANLIFQDWVIIGQPNGEWTAYIVIWVRTCDPFVEFEKVSGEIKNIANIITKIEEAAEQLNLPSFGHQYRIRPILFGSEILDYFKNNIPVYSHLNPPYLELRGIWDKDFKIVLYKVDKVTGQQSVLSELIITDELTGINSIIDLFEEQAEEGKYSIRIDEYSIDFYLKLIDKNWINNDIPRINIETRFQDFSGSTIINVSRYGLKELTIYITAWYCADLILEVFSSDAQYSNQYPLIMDEKGQKVYKISDLPFEFSKYPAGNIIFQISWRGIFKSKLIALDKDYVSTKDVDIIIKKIDNKEILNCSGIMEGKKVAHNYVGLLLYKVPWEKPPQIFDIMINADGHFIGQVYLDWKPAWILIGVKGLNQKIEPIVICRNENESLLETKNNKYDIDSLLTHFPNEWTYLAESISKISHPPELEFFIQVEPLLSLMNETNSREKLVPHWCFYQFGDELEIIKKFAEKGYHMALFHHKQIDKGLAQRVEEVKINFAEYNQETMRFPFYYNNDPHTHGEITIVESPMRAMFSLQANVILQGCLKCGVIVPSHKFNNHETPYSEYENCTGIRPSFYVYRSDQEGHESVCIAVLIEPSIELFSLHKQFELLLKNGTIKSSQYQMILKRFENIVHPNENRLKWLEELLCAIKQYWSIHSSKYIQGNKLLTAAKAVAKYNKAMTIILTFIEEQVK